MPVANAAVPVIPLAGFQIVEQFPCLGFILQGSGSTRAEAELVRDHCWKAFWRNLRHSRSGCISQESRLKIALHAISPIADYRVSRWPVSSGRSHFIDRLQRQIFTKCVVVASIPCETAAEYVRRRSHITSGILRSVGLWSTRMCRRVLCWHRHINRDPDHPALAVLAFRDSKWLAERRLSILPRISDSAWTSAAGRTRTRARSGIIQQRWDQAIAFAGSYITGIG